MDLQVEKALFLEDPKYAAIEDFWESPHTQFRVVASVLQGFGTYRPLFRPMQLLSKGLGPYVNPGGWLFQKKGQKTQEGIQLRESLRGPPTTSNFYRFTNFSSSSIDFPILVVEFT